MKTNLTEILNTSIEILNKYGVTKFGIRILGRKMKLSTTTIYKYVKGKMGLYSLICEHICELVYQKINEEDIKNNPKDYLFCLCNGLRNELLKIRNSAAIFYETIPCTPKHIELKPNIMKALIALGVKEEKSFSLACILFDYIVFSVWDEEFFRLVSKTNKQDVSLNFYKNHLKEMDYNAHYKYGLDILLKG